MSWITVKSGNQFGIIFDPHGVTELPFILAAENAARSIAEQYSDLKLCLSGGTDSEFVFRLFHRLGLPIEPVVVRSELNRAESDIALAVCEELNVLPTMIDLSVEDFFLSHFKAVQEYGVRVLLGATPLVIHSRVGGSILTGYGDPTPDHGAANCIMLPEWDFYTARLGNHPGAFFAHDATLFLAYLRDIRKDIPIQEAKCQLYGLAYREKIKYESLVYSVQQRFKLASKFKFEIDSNELQALLRAEAPFEL